MVWVTPGKLPAKVIVAPNSPSARAQHSTAPANSDGPMRGSVTRVNTLHRLAPSARAGFSSLRFHGTQARLDGEDEERHGDKCLRHHNARGREWKRDTERGVKPGSEQTAPTE